MVEDLQVGATGQGVLVLLAGGRSSRFGAAKANLRIDDEPILDWHRRRLVAALIAAIGRTASAWLSLPPEKSGAAALPVGADRYDRILRDTEPFAGPTAGLMAGLAAAGDDDVLLLATVDMPLIGAEQVARLVNTLAAPGCIGALSRWADGPDVGVVEPFPSLWRVGASRPAITSLVVAQGLGVGPKALASLNGVMCIDLHHPADRAGWSNINRPADAAQVEAVLGARVTWDL